MNHDADTPRPDTSPGARGGSEERPPRKSLLTHNRSKEEESDSGKESPGLKAKPPEPELKAPETSRLKSRSFGAPRAPSKSSVPPPPPEPEPEPEPGGAEDTEHGSMVPKAKPLPAAEAGSNRQTSSPGLSSRMAEIHSTQNTGEPRRSTSSTPSPNATATSTLPEAMARLQGKSDPGKSRSAGASATSAPAESKREEPPPARSIQMTVDDPDPGWKLSSFWFVFCFGRYANGAMLAQPVRKTLLCLLVCAFGTLLHTMRWLAPPVPGPGPLFETAYLLRVFGIGTAAGVGFYCLLSLVFNLVVRSRFGRVGLLFGLRGVVHAMLPLALVQCAALIVATAQLGEAFWRGAVPEWLRVLEWWVLPALWVWGGLRLAQAVCRLVRLPFLRAAIVLTLTPLAALAVLAPFHPILDRIMREERRAEWAAFEQDFASETPDMGETELESLERSISFREVERRREFLLMKLELHSRRGEIRQAREEAWRLDRLSPPGSAYDHVAKGLNLLLLDRPEYAIERLEASLELDPDLAAAHHWLALYYLRSDPARAETHARRALDEQENVFNLQLLVSALAAQGKQQAIWDAMLSVDAAPEEWHVQTLRLVSAAAEQLGNVKRAEELRAIAARKSRPETESE